jgi:Flp pilus assembly protein TadG
VEFALCAPLLFLLAFAAWEFSRANMILNTMENACYEGCRRGIVPGATAADVQAAAQAVMNSAFATSTDIQVVPSVITNNTPEVTVTILAPLDQNAWVTPFFLNGLTIRSSYTLARERDDTVLVP